MVSAILMTAFLVGSLSVSAQKQVNATAPQAVMLSDDFESYSTFPAGNWVNNNSSSVWTVEQEASKIVHQSAVQTSIVSIGNNAWTNYRVSALVRSNVLGIRSGIMARYTSSSSYYSLYLRSTSTGGTKVLEINKRIGSTNNYFPPVSVPIVAGTFYKLTLEVDGSNIKAYVNDELKISVVDTEITSGRVGFYNTGDSSYDNFVVEETAVAPNAPTNLAATAGNSQIGLTWTGSSGATSYIVKRSTVDGGPYQNVATVSTASYTDTDVNFGTTYYYAVSAVNTYGESANSNQSSASPLLVVPAVPSGLHTASGNGEAKLFWTVSPTSTNYYIKRSLSNGGTYTTVGNVTGTEFTDSGLTNGTTYYYRISAANDAGESANSGAVSALPRVGQIVNVANQTQLTSALNTAVAGDTIVLADGNYSASKVRRKYGTAQNPIVIKSQNALGAVFNAGQLELENTVYMTVESIRFTLSTSIKLRGTQYNRMTRNSFELNETGLTDLDWISMGSGNSHHNRIDHNDFKNKVTLGNFITLIGENAQVTQYDLIDHNYFFNLGPRAENEKESVRLGDSSVSQSSGFTTVEYNLFEQCDGDPEIVSIKTHDNIVRYNTFRRSKGGLTARQGNRSKLYGNFFLGENVDGTGGIRAYGDDHLIYNNYFEGLTGTANYAALAITNGDADNAELPGADQSKHYRPQRIVVANNTFVNNVSNIEIGGSYTLAPRDIILANNLITGNTGQLIKYRTAPITPVYTGNIAFPTGTATIGITATEAEFRNVNPLLVTENSLQKLGAGSPAIDASVNNYAYLTEDFEGQLRDALKDVGADEFGSSSLPRVPLTSVNAGLNANDFSIFGRIVDALGEGISGVTVVLSQNQTTLASTISATTLTDANGNYQITDIVPNQDYTLTISKPNYTFSPNSITVSNLSADTNFSPTGLIAPTAANISVSGKVLQGKSGVSRVQVFLTNQSGENIVVSTNSFGNFIFNEVAAGQTYILSARNKNQQFGSQIITLNESVQDLVIQGLDD